MKTKLILFDGVIASGKTCALSHIEERNDLHKAIEPVEMYRKYEGSNKIYNALGLYYENPKENAVCLQLHIIECLEKLTMELPQKLVLLERHLVSVYAFTLTMLELNFISKFSAEYIFEKLKQALHRTSKNFEIEKIIFLDTDVDICLNRWVLRERREEMSFSIAEMRKYLTVLRSNYLKFYQNEFPSQLVIVKNNDMRLVRNLVSESLGVAHART